MKVGIEIHQQLDTRHKLFCGCPTALSERDPDYSVVRRLRPTQSEMGQVDRAALFESTRRKRFVYQGHYGSACLVELDEEPPHGLNPEAVSVALTVAAMMNMKPVDEIHVMRKIVIDGSNTTGFQRTAKVALDGWIEVGGRKVTVQSLCLEEDAARKVSELSLI
ncbi:MAG: Glu-tRNA(Gln) amidotransferase GatDE subunit E, partial [Nitrososphaeria archaeon]|nr:Glu-tRNA(Gln) amidotransferase GatDE subunit E [Nitrososphaeria archaeon]